MPSVPIRAKRTSTRPDEFLNGVPNRDLTEDDWDQLDAEQRDLIRKSDIYEVPTEAEFKKLKEEKEAQSEPAVRKDEPTALTHPATPHAGHPAPRAPKEGK